MIDAFRAHWPEYLREGGLLGLFMISAAGFGVLFFHPASPAAPLLPEGLPRLLATGLAMGGTLVALVHSPWGKRSGAHMNPATTLAFFALGRIRGADALFYALFQTLGGAAGLALAALALGPALADARVAYVVTIPGPLGPAVALAAEGGITFVLFFSILVVSNSKRAHRFTGLVAATLLATYIAFESPLSGTSMNPARTAASSIVSGNWTAFWVYLVAPPTATLAAAATFVALRGARAVHCAKLHHENGERCIFRCRFGELGETPRIVPASTREIARSER